MQTLCSNCNATFKVADQFQGKRAKCPKCQSVFVVEPFVNPAPKESPSRTAVSASTAPSTQTQSRPDLASPSPAISNDTDLSQWPPQQRHHQIMSGFKNKFERPRTSIAYRLGLMAAMLVMMLLPLLYAGFIGLVGYVVWWHLSHNWVIFQHVRGRGAAFAFLIYLAPAVAGIIAVIFMFKPILARPAKKPRTRSLTAQGEPVLFAFVQRICSDVGAPIPKRIDIDNEVNASASFRAGWWSLIRGNDLVLTLGMPLIQGLTLQQLAGVIAHEFGHFSQGAGMRVSYILRSINFWFIRAVYERDSWDAWLEAASTETDLRFGWIFYVARMAVWISRRFLWCLLSLGNLLTGLIQQQMEYDADRYEVGMAGRSTFASTFHSMRTASIGYQQAMGTLGRVANEGRLVSDFPRLAAMHIRKIPKDKLKEVLDKAMEEKTQLFASHPADRDRIAAAEKASDEGAFISELPATALLFHFEEECEGVTKDMYQALLGKGFSEKKIVPTTSVMEEESREDAAWEALNRFFMEAIAPTREFPLPNYQTFAPSDPAHAAKLIAKARQAMSNSYEHYRSSVIIQEQAENLERSRGYVDRMKRKFSKVDESILQPKDGAAKPGFPNPDPAVAQQFVKASVIRLHTGCCLLNDPATAAGIATSAQSLQKISVILPTLEALDKMLGRIKEFESLFGYQVYCCGHFERIKGDQSILAREVLGVSEQIVSMYSEFRNAFLNLPYPFEHADKSMTVGKHLTTDILLSEEVGTVLNAAESLISEYYMLRGRCLGHLAIAAETVEACLGLPPLEIPKHA